MKRILSLLLALITVLSVPVTASAATTAHKGASSWAIESIVEAEKIGLIPQELYPLKYKEAITREEFASLIVSLYELTTGEEMKEKPHNASDRYVDVEDNTPYTKYIYKVAGANIAGETGRDSKYLPYFSPKGNLTREQAATMATRLFRNLGHIFKDLKETKFNDASKISTWAEKEVQLMQSEGILTGVGKGNFAPKEMYTVEQSIVTMLRVFKHIHLEAYPEQFILDRILPREKEYPTGTYWGDDTVNDSPWQNASIGIMACDGFAALVSESGFGGLLSSTSLKSYSENTTVRLGDLISYSTGSGRHVVVVIDIAEDGLLTVAEGNYGSQVNWGRQIRLKKGDVILTRYPKRQAKWLDYVGYQEPERVKTTKTSEQKLDENISKVTAGTDSDLHDKLDLVKNVQQDIDSLSDITEVMDFLEKTYTRYHKRGLDITLKEYMRLSLNTFYAIAEAKYPKDSLNYVEGPSAIDYVIQTMEGR